MDHVNVIIVGAGLSGVGAAAHLVEQCPEKTFTLLEGRAAVGGTWDLFRYPGIRSDSDMHTLGYSFKPWTQAKSIADGPSIRDYVNETADEFDIRRHIRFDHKVQTASWDSTQSRWVLTAPYPMAAQPRYLATFCLCAAAITVTTNPIDQNSRVNHATKARFYILNFGQKTSITTVKR